MAPSLTNPQPSPGELVLLRHLWRQRQLSAREVHTASQEQTGWAYSTTRKTLERMVDKALIKVELVHGIKTFIPMQSKLKTLATLISDFATNILDSDQPLPAATFVNSRLISEDEIEELEALLEQLGQGKDKSAEQVSPEVHAKINHKDCAS